MPGTMPWRYEWCASTVANKTFRKTGEQIGKTAHEFGSHPLNSLLILQLPVKDFMVNKCTPKSLRMSMLLMYKKCYSFRASSGSARIRDYLQIRIQIRINISGLYLWVDEKL